MFRRMLRCFTHLFVQDDASERLLRGAGVEARDITVCGDTRFDRVTDTLRSARPCPRSKHGSMPREAATGLPSWPEAVGDPMRMSTSLGSPPILR